jgi:hypothetical protein
LIQAVRAGDTARLNQMFGPGGENIIASGDAVADAQTRERFAALYEKKHTLVPDGSDRMILQVGAEDWPLPVPLEKRGNRWYFDGAEGAEEVTNRRIGHNELGAIAVCRGYVEAQREYASEDRDGVGAGVYAQKLMSDPGTQNGLYWDASPGQSPSPIGPFIAQAAAEGYRAGGTASPYHGYRYRPLFRQGQHANRGSMDYFVKGHLVNGFALVAWPAEYGVSGIMTFIVNQDGVVFEKDLGPETATIAAAMNSYDPDSTWVAVIDSGEAPAS